MITTDEFNNQLKNIFGNIYHTDDKYIGAKKKLRVHCTKCGNIFMSTPTNLKSGHGCPYCSGNHKYSNSEYQALVIKKYANEFSVVSNYVNGRSKVVVRCNNCNSETEVQASHFLKSQYKCPICSGRVRSYTTKTFKRKITLLFNTRYTVIGEYTGTFNKILVRCNTCGNTSYMIPNQLIQGHGCSYCANNQHYTQDTANKEIKSLSCGNYSLVGTYKNNRTPVAVKCSACGNVWLPTLTNLKKGEGCPYCSGLHPYTPSEFSELVDNKFNGRYSVVDNYINTDTRISVTCNECGNSWRVRPYNLLSGKGCPYCRSSKGEILIKEYLDNNNIKYTQQKKFSGLKDKSWLSYDFYLPDLKVLIEYQGIQHFFPVSLFGGEKQLKIQNAHDTAKRNYANLNGYTLLEPSYELGTYDSISSYLSNSLAFSLDCQHAKQRIDSKI